jgi:hypothetical protein
MRANVTAQKSLVEGHKKLTNKIHNKAVCTLMMTIIIIIIEDEEEY